MKFTHFHWKARARHKKIIQKSLSMLPNCMALHSFRNQRDFKFWNKSFSFNSNLCIIPNMLRKIFECNYIRVYWHMGFIFVSLCFNFEIFFNSSLDCFRAHNINWIVRSFVAFLSSSIYYLQQQTVDYGLWATLRKIHWLILHDYDRRLRTKWSPSNLLVNYYIYHFFISIDWLE